ncbi:O-antigen chain-terminating methyltransferase [Desulfacinum infernum DSM 9756]|uniref:O-antigen chain-terminating methyltransferase n=1 Tax=Desulfacinum infernum DSM 9756 TaxID=1121391 RepID=A0A1M4SWZ8_9BACT|nr:class I SAM-dependent methyltransferase [Desulfacinum infernum]SHE36547.1 O-antigen chain-terminating methyltransferase [Desulfacinum infernum DSM 9756]
MNRDLFYRFFEDKFRGSRDTIKFRLEIYEPLLQQLKSIYPSGEVLDLGCGRGEWLELLRDWGIKAKGVDINEEMVNECLGRGLNAHIADAVSYLSAEEDEKFVAVTGFHLAEHIEFSQLTELAREALRTLKPSGVMILETPNPENILVGISGFYIDPYHIRPLPSQLLKFLLEYIGFARAEILHLNEDSCLRNREQISLIDVLSGASPDYAVIAQKEPLIDAGFIESYISSKGGLSLLQLAEIYENQRSRILERKNEELLAAQNRIEAEIGTLQEQLAAIYASRSWKLTAPLRWCYDQAGNLFHGALAPMRNGHLVLHRPLHLGMLQILERPSLAEPLRRLIARFPWLHERLRAWAIRRGLLFSIASEAPVDYPWPEEIGTGHLSAHARRIYADLKRALDAADH